jgi:Prp18 domain
LTLEQPSLRLQLQAWPIGVTSIGIHDRTAREKLSYYSNEKSQAHIMNDEATRKYLHGVSRLIKGVQGLRPTDPSRSVNFNAFKVCSTAACVTAAPSGINLHQPPAHSKCNF